MLKEKTNRFMMGYSVSQGVDFVKFVENIGVVVLDLSIGAVFIGENIQKSSSRYSILK